MNAPDPVLFGARIRRERQRQGLSRRQLSIKAGVAGATIITYMETAKRETGVFRAARIAAALGLSLDALLAPPDCPGCDGMPPAGFICPSCSKLGGAV